MPDQITVSEFIAETTEDYNSPTTSSFTTRLQNCRNTVTLLEERCGEISFDSPDQNAKCVRMLVKQNEQELCPSDSAHCKIAIKTSLRNLTQRVPSSPH